MFTPGMYSIAFEILYQKAMRYVPNHLIDSINIKNVKEEFQKV